MHLYFKAEMKRALLSRPFFVGLALAVVSMAAWIMPEFRHYPDLAEMGRNGALYWFIWAHSGYISLFAPILATLPFTRSYAEERNGGFSRFVLQRLPSFRYWVVKLVSNAMAGGLVLALPSAAALCMSTAAFPMYPRPYLERLPSYFFYDLGPPAGLVYMGLQVATAFLYGALSATLGLAASVLFRNAFIANISTFTLFMIVGFLFAFAGFGHLNPMFLWSPSAHTWSTTTSFAAMHFVAWCLGLIVYGRYFRLREE